jgi:uncharacterized protein (TIGR03435 family)
VRGGSREPKFSAKSFISNTYVARVGVGVPLFSKMDCGILGGRWLRVGKQRASMFPGGRNMQNIGRTCAGGNSFVNASPKYLFAVLFTAILIGIAPPLRAQSQPAAAASPVFEYDVASIKLNISGGGSIGMHNAPDSYSVTNVPVQTLMQWAFGIQSYQMMAAPEWFTSERYDIEAKMDPAVADALQKLNVDDRRIARQHMLQALVLGRLKLTIHRETRELPIYSLVIGKSGSKLQETKPSAPGVPVPRGGVSVRTSRTGSGPITLTVLHCTNTELAGVFVPHVGRTIIDKTGLTSVYDFTLQFLPDDAAVAPAAGSALSAPDPTVPSIFTAIQEQLGLKLESGKGPVEVVVIDHVERPSGN